ncbi:MAG: GMC oxidoreductase [Gemmatimonadota bacterium]
MSLVDARQLGPSCDLSADVCIVGAGAAGITLASELAAARIDVILLESGGFQPDPDTQALYDLESVGYPIRESFMSRARYFGGSCNLWAGRCMRLEPADVADRSWVADSGWPIPYEEVERWYPAAARILGLPPVDRFDPRAWASELSGVERALFDADELIPTVSLWAPRAKRFARYGKRLGKSRNVSIVLHANVTEIELAEDGRSVTRLRAATLDGGRLHVHAAVFILACGGLENARLLLASREVQPHGVGNAHDQVGRYFMDHPRAVFGSVRLKEARALPLLGGRPLPDGRVQLGLGLAEETRRREGLLNHYATFESTYSQYAAHTYQSFVRTMKVLLRRGYAGSRFDLGRGKLGAIPDLIYLLTPRELMPHRAYRWYVRARDALRRKRGPVERTVVYFCEQPPDPESRVTLSDRRDPLGLPRLALRWRIGDAVIASVRRLEEILASRLRETGTGELIPGDVEPRFSDASHHLGTTRMSADPKRGVVDGTCRVHGVENLWVAGSSVFPSAGHANPTLTIVGLALRLADHLRRLPALSR